MAKQTELMIERQQALIDAYRAVLARADAVIRAQQAVIDAATAVIRAQQAVIDAATAPVLPATIQAVDLAAGHPVD